MPSLFSSFLQHSLESQRFRPGCRWFPKWHFKGQFFRAPQPTVLGFIPIICYSHCQQCNSTFLSHELNSQQRQKRTYDTVSHGNSRYKKLSKGNSMFLCKQWSVWSWLSSRERRSRPAVSLVVPGPFFSLIPGVAWWFFFIGDSGTDKGAFIHLFSFFRDVPLAATSAWQTQDTLKTMALSRLRSYPLINCQMLK